MFVFLINRSPWLLYLQKYQLLSKFVIFRIGPTGFLVITDLVCKAVISVNKVAACACTASRSNKLISKSRPLEIVAGLISVRHHACLQKKGNEKRLIGLLYFSFTPEGSKTFLTILMPEYLIWIMVLFCTPALRTWENPDANIGPKVCRPDLRLSCFSSVPQCKCWNNICSKLCHCRLSFAVSLFNYNSTQRNLSSWRHR
jgi:hypothetical protein